MALPSPSPALSSAVLRKATIRLFRDIRLRLRRQSTNTLISAVAVCCISLFFMQWIAFALWENRPSPYGNHTPGLLPSRFFARASASEPHSPSAANVGCSCEPQALSWTHLRRALSSAKFVALVVVVPEILSARGDPTSPLQYTLNSANEKKSSSDGDDTSAEGEVSTEEAENDAAARAVAKSLKDGQGTVTTLKILNLFKGHPRMASMPLVVRDNETFPCRGVQWSEADYDQSQNDGLNTMEWNRGTDLMAERATDNIRNQGEERKLDYKHTTQSEDEYLIRQRNGNMVATDISQEESNFDESFLIVGDVADSGECRRLNATVLQPTTSCGIVWAVRWVLLSVEVRESIVKDPADGSSWWRTTGAWALNSDDEWWNPNTTSGNNMEDGQIVDSFNMQSEFQETDTKTSIYGSRGEHTVEGANARVSIVAACQDRKENLKVASRSWAAVRGVSEIVILDWSSDGGIDVDSIATELHNDERLVLGHIPDQTSWILGRAYNIAFRMASSGVILKVDCDSQLDEDFLESHPIREKEFYAGDWRVLGPVTEETEQLHVNGLLLVHRADLLGVGGYDERLITYGWDDTDLATRLAHVSRANQFDYSKVSHLPHAATLRTKKQHGMTLLPFENPLAALVEIQRNRLLLSKFHLPIWTQESKHVQYNVASFRLQHENSSPQAKGKFVLLFEQANNIRSAIELVSQEDALDISKRAIRLILVRFGVALLPKALSLGFYERLASKVGFPDLYAQVVINTQGGCAARLLSVASSQIAGSTDVPTQSKTHTAGPFISKLKGWRIRTVWKHPDFVCSCHVANSFILRETEVVTQFPTTWEQGKLLFLGNESGPLTDVGEALSSISPEVIGNVTESKSAFVLQAVCDIKPENASVSHQESMRNVLQSIRPGKEMQDAIVGSLSTEEPAQLDPPVRGEAWYELLDESDVKQLQGTFENPAVRTMASLWGASSVAGAHLPHDLTSRAMALTAALLIRVKKPELFHNLTTPTDGFRPADAADQLFHGCPASAAEYLVAYPELAVMAAGMISAGTCTSGLSVRVQ